MAVSPGLQEILEELRSDRGNLPRNIHRDSSIVGAHLLRIARRLLIQATATSILYFASFSVTGYPVLAFGTVGVYVLAGWLNLAPANSRSNAVRLSLLPISLNLNLHVGVVFSTLVFVLLLNRVAQRPKNPKCAPRHAGGVFELFWVSLWIPQIAIGVVTYSLQRHQPSNEFLWSLAREGYRTEPWILGLTCLIFIITGALKSADRGFQK